MLSNLSIEPATMALLKQLMAIPELQHFALVGVISLTEK